MAGDPGPTDERQRRLQEVRGKIERELGQQTTFSVDEWLGRYPDLEPELGVMLRKMIESERTRPLPSRTVDIPGSSETIDLPPGLSAETLAAETIAPPAGPDRRIRTIHPPRPVHPPRKERRQPGRTTTRRRQAPVNRPAPRSARRCATSAIMRSSRSSAGAAWGSSTRPAAQPQPPRRPEDDPERRVRRATTSCAGSRTRPRPSPRSTTPASCRSTRSASTRASATSA